MIKSFRNRRLKRLFENNDPQGLAAEQIDKLRDILAALDAAAEPAEAGLFPGWRLHPLKGNLKGFRSVTVTGNGRVVFRFRKATPSTWICRLPLTRRA